MHAELETRLLLIEDKEQEVELIRTYLQEAQATSFTLISAPRLATGLSLLSQVEVDLVLLDLSLPDSQGFQTFADLYAQADHLPLIILTDLEDHELAGKTIRAGAQDYLIKGHITPHLLIHTIHHALERKRAQEALKKRNRELAVLNAIARDINQSLRMEEVLSRTLDNILTLDLFGPTPGKGLIFLKQPNAQMLTLAAAKRLPEDLPCMHKPIEWGECYCGMAAAQGKALVSDYNVEIKEAPSHPDLQGQKTLCIPLMAGGEVVGVMTLWLPIRQKITKEQVDLLRAISEQVTIAVKNARLYEMTQQRMIELDTLNRASQTINAVLNVEEALHVIVNEVKAMLRAEGTSILLYEPGREELVFAATSGPGAEQLRGRRMPADAGIAGWVLREWRALRLEDAQADPRYYQAIDAALDITPHAMIAVPMISRGKIVGVLEANREAPFTEHELELVRTLGGSAAIAIENARLYEAEREQRKLAEQSQVQLMHNQRLAATGELTASLAHEINNSLQAIHNSLQIILSFPLEPEEQQSYLKMTDEEIERLIRMVKRILDFSRRPENAMQPLQINRVVKKVLGLAHKYLEHRKISLTTSLAADLPKVEGNATALGQVFLNLIINAVEAMPEGGALDVTTALTSNEHLAVHISDTGPGIPAAALDHIFEPFFSTKPEGTGLGLSISQSIIRQHGGHIDVETEPDEGTTFTVSLPTINTP